MIEETAGRFQSTARTDLDFAKLLVVGSKRHEALLEDQLPGADMVLEPMGRNSAPAVAAACLARAPEDLVLILPADHDIRDVAAFHDAIAIAAEAAQDGAIVTFGIEPTHPATGYGYIKTVATTASSQALDVDAFVEKPDAKTAQSYLDAGTYYWNAGIFLFKAGVMSDALEQFVPEVLAGTREAMGDPKRAKIDLQPEAFAATPSISVDYAVMEKASNVKTVPVSMGWSDVGGYRALHELLTDNETDNHTSGPVHMQNSSGLYVRSEGPAISVNGVSDLVIVATESEVMITPKDDDAAVKELGKVVQNDRYGLGISPALRARARNWLWTAFDTWSRVGWDPVRGGFVEQLHMDGTPDADAIRRVRVQARQVFSFAKAIELGWDDPDIARDLIKKGLQYIDRRLRHPDGGWVHLVAPDGQAIDDKRDFYDHAFLILAGAEAYRSTNDPLALKIADDAISFINNDLSDPLHGGWLESVPHTLPRRANPHMHVLEAMLAYYNATGREVALKVAKKVVQLFETKFFKPGVDILVEHFAADWHAETAMTAWVFEPGHHYEWATLLAQYGNLTGHDTRSFRRRLIATADKFGINETTGFAYNALTASGDLVDSNSRLWHNLEKFRSLLLHRDSASTDRIETLFNAIFEHYLEQGPAGGWMDQLDQDGRPISKDVPASMLYHAVTALEVIV